MRKLSTRAKLAIALVVFAASSGFVGWYGGLAFMLPGQQRPVYPDWVAACALIATVLVVISGGVLVYTVLRALLAQQRA